MRQKIKRFWDGSETQITQTICKQFAPCCRQITTPTPNRLLFQAGCCSWPPANSVEAPKYQYHSGRISLWCFHVAVVSFIIWTKLLCIGPSYYWVGWLPLGGFTILVCNQLVRSCIPRWSQNRVPAVVGVKVGMSVLRGGRQHCVPMWHVSSLSDEVSCKLLYSIWFTLTCVWMQQACVKLLEGCSSWAWEVRVIWQWQLAAPTVTGAVLCVTSAPTLARHMLPTNKVSYM